MKLSDMAKTLNSVSEAVEAADLKDWEVAGSPAFAVSLVTLKLRRGDEVITLILKTTPDDAGYYSTSLEFYHSLLRDPLIKPSSDSVWQISAGTAKTMASDTYLSGSLKTALERYGLIREQLDQFESLRKETLELVKEI